MQVAPGPCRADADQSGATQSRVGRDYELLEMNTLIPAAKRTETLGFVSDIAPAGRHFQRLDLVGMFQNEKCHGV